MRALVFVLAVFAGPVLWAESARAQTTPNILMIIADDVGADMIGAYHGGVGHPHTPNIDQLAAEGVRFSTVWSNPLCAATRSTIQTGRYGYRTGLVGGNGVLPEGALTIPKVLAAAGSAYKTAIIGKWGLATSAMVLDRTKHAVRAGYNHFAGSPFTGINSYFNWQRYVATYNPALCSAHDNDACIDGSIDTVTTFATATNVADAEAWIAPNKDHPWFLVLAFNAAHFPYEAPPDGTHDLALQTPAGSTCAGTEVGPCYQAMIEAMDQNIGALRTWLQDEQEFDQTVVIFVGDNGSPHEAVDLDPARGKGSLFESGVRVPLIARGVGVAGNPQAPRVSGALVNTSDLFTTVLELAGVPASAVATAVTVPYDSFSLVPTLAGTAGPTRQYAYADIGEGKAIRERADYKLFVTREGTGNEATLHWHFYKLSADAAEASNLVYEQGTQPVLIGSDPEQAAHLARLSQLLGDPPDGVSTQAPNIPAANEDHDADAVADLDDNCRDVSQSQSQRCDTDQDGYGNVCDGDFNQSGAVNSLDYTMFFAPALATGIPDSRGTDMDCSGAVNSFDYTMFFIPQLSTGAPPGPSGLTCAGTVPCP